MDPTKTTAYEQALLIARQEMKYIRDCVYGTDKPTEQKKVTGAGVSNKHAGIDDPTMGLL